MGRRVRREEVPKRHPAAEHRCSGHLWATRKRARVHEVQDALQRQVVGKKGVTVREEDEAGLDAWYAMYQETSRRDRIPRRLPVLLPRPVRRRSALRGQAACRDSSYGQARGGPPAGQHLCLLSKARHIPHGRVPRTGKRDLMSDICPLQWEPSRGQERPAASIQTCMASPPNPDPDHPMFGLYQFRSGLPTRVERWGTWDVAFGPLLYALYREAGSPPVMVRG